MATQTSGKIFTRDFILCFLAQTAFGFVYYLLIPTLPIYLSRVESTETEIGVLIGILSISSMVLKPFIGKALLKIPAKTFMVAGGLLFVLTSLAYLVAPPFWPFFAIRVLQGVGLALFHTASYTLVASSSSASTRAQSLSYYIMAWNISGALGPAVGMFLINQFNFTFLFLACFALSLCTLFAVVKLESNPVNPSQESSKEEGVLLSVKALPPSMINFFAFFIWGGITAFFPIYAINLGVLNPGYFFTTTAIMLILGRVLGGRIMDIYGGNKIIPPCLVTYILSVAIIAFSTTLPMFLVAATLFGIGHAFLIPLLMVYALDRGGAPGSVMGTFHAAIDLGLGLGPVTMGIILHMTSYRTMFLSLTIVGILSLIYFYFFLRERKDT